MLIEYKGHPIKVVVGANNVQIVDSRLYRTKEDMRNIIALIREETAKLGYTYSRSEKSWLHEWRAHNLLFEIQYQMERTKSVDLNEDESKFRLFMYRIISFFYFF